jgi:hypothetical protein
MLDPILAVAHASEAEIGGATAHQKQAYGDG